MIPISFGDIAARLHPPAPGKQPSGLGVVIVPPHGLEALAAAKSLRLLAEQLSAAGHAVLRFDLPGTGDSLDGESEADPIARWTQSVADAARELRGATGVGGIALVGLRFGALLAAAATARVDNLAGLVLLDPVTSGRNYARELAMTAKMIAEGARLDPAATATDDGLLIGGLLTTTATLDGLRGLSLAKLATDVPALALHRPGARDVIAAMVEWSNATTAVEPIAGFEAIGLSPTMAVTPHLAFARAADWIDALPKCPVQLRPEHPAARLAGPHFIEESFVFGPSERLFGVLCRPLQPLAHPVALVIVNAGRNPHTGWARSSVTLARRLAGEGVATLRFDLSGIGEGLDRPGAVDHVDDLLYMDTQDEELTAAIDLVSNRGFASIAVLGACSGAYLALRGARDSRVAHLVLVNLQRFVWRAGETVSWAIANHYPVASSYVGKVADARAWRRLLTGERKLAPLLKVLLGRAIRRFGRWRTPSETVQARALVKAAIDRGAGIEFVYSEDDQGLVELAYHFGSRGRDLKDKPGIKLHFVPDADHDLTPTAARERMFGIAEAAMRNLQGQIG